MVDNIVNIGLYITYVLFFVAVIGVIVLPIIKLMDQPKVLARTGMVSGVLLGIFLLSWAISDNEVTKLYESFSVDASLSKMIGGSIIMTYLLFFITIALTIYGEISKLIK